MKGSVAIITLGLPLTGGDLEDARALAHAIERTALRAPPPRELDLAYLMANTGLAGDLSGDLRPVGQLVHVGLIEFR